MIADRNLYLTADRERVVEENDPAAAFMFYSKGKEIPDNEAERYGLKPAAVEPKQDDESANKQAPEPANKARKAAKKTTKKG